MIISESDVYYASLQLIRGNLIEHIIWYIVLLLLNKQSVVVHKIPLKNIITLFRDVFRNYDYIIYINHIINSTPITRLYRSNPHWMRVCFVIYVRSVLRIVYNLVGIYYYRWLFYFERTDDSVYALTCNSKLYNINI